MSNPEDRIRELPFSWKFNPHPATDYIDMEFVLRDLDPGLRKTVVAARLDAISKVHANIADMHRNIAEGTGNIARMISGGKASGK